MLPTGWWSIRVSRFDRTFGGPHIPKHLSSARFDQMRELFTSGSFTSEEAVPAFTSGDKFSEAERKAFFWLKRNDRVSREEFARVVVCELLPVYCRSNEALPVYDHRQFVDCICHLITLLSKPLAGTPRSPLSPKHRSLSPLPSLTQQQMSDRMHQGKPSHMPDQRDAPDGSETSAAGGIDSVEGSHTDDNPEASEVKDSEDCTGHTTAGVADWDDWSYRSGNREQQGKGNHYGKGESGPDLKGKGKGVGNGCWDWNSGWSDQHNDQHGEYDDGSVGAGGKGYAGYYGKGYQGYTRGSGKGYAGYDDSNVKGKGYYSQYGKGYGKGYGGHNHGHGKGHGGDYQNWVYQGGWWPEEAFWNESDESTIADSGKGSHGRKAADGTTDNANPCMLAQLYCRDCDSPLCRACADKLQLDRPLNLSNLQTPQTPNAAVGGESNQPTAAPDVVRSFGQKGSRPGEFCDPWGVAVDQNGNLVVTECGNHRVSVLRIHDAELICSFGSEGAADGQFQDPRGVVIAADGTIVVADCWNHRVQIFKMDGTWVRSFGSEGTSPGQFRNPCGLAIDADGNLIVVETGNHRVQLVHMDGTPIRSFGGHGIKPGKMSHPSCVTRLGKGIAVTDTGNHRVQVFRVDGSHVCTIGKQGVEYGQFENPVGVAVDIAGNLVVCDSYNHRVQVLRMDGSYLWSCGSEGPGDGQWEHPAGVAIDSMGNLLVADQWNHRCCVVTPPWVHIDSTSRKTPAQVGHSQYPQTNTAVLSKIEDVKPTEAELGNLDLSMWRSTKYASGFRGVHCVMNGQFQSVLYYEGSYHDLGTYDSANRAALVIAAKYIRLQQSAKTSRPRGFATDSIGHLVVADCSSHRIEFVQMDGTFVRAIGCHGKGRGCFVEPWAVVVDHSDNLIVVDRGNDRLQVVGMDGSPLQVIGSTGSAAGQFRDPRGVAVTSDGDIVVADTYNHRIQIFKSDGTWVRAVGELGSQQGQMNLPSSVAIDSQDRVIVAEWGNNRIQVMQLDGTHVHTIGAVNALQNGLMRPTAMAIDTNNNLFVSQFGTPMVSVFAMDGKLLRSVDAGDFGPAYNPPDGVHLVHKNRGSSKYLPGGHSSNPQAVLALLISRQ